MFFRVCGKRKCFESLLEVVGIKLKYIYLICCLLSFECGAMQPERRLVRTFNDMFAAEIDFEADIIQNTGYGEDNKYGSCVIISLGCITDEYGEGQLTKTRLYNKITDFIIHNSAEELCSKIQITLEQLERLKSGLQSNCDFLSNHTAYSVVSFLYSVDIGIFLPSSNGILQQDAFYRMVPGNRSFADWRCVIISIEGQHADQLKLSPIPVRINGKIPERIPIISWLQNIVDKSPSLLASASMTLEVIKSLLLKYKQTLSDEEKKYLSTMLNCFSQSNIIEHFKESNEKLINEITEILI